MTGNMDCATECTQEAFLRAFERFDALRDHNRFSNWVTSIALNLARDALRKRARELPVGQDINGLSINADRESAEDLHFSAG